jgi:hypothetical protein
VEGAKRQAPRSKEEARERLALALALDTKVPERAPGELVEGTGEAVVIVHPDGPTAARESLQARQALAKGARVLLVDVGVPKRDQSVRHFLTFNKSDDALRVQAVAGALAFMNRQRPGGVKLVGIGRAAVWATFAAASAGLPVTLDAPLADFQGTDRDFLDKFFVPCIQRAGGLEAALLALR